MRAVPFDAPVPGWSPGGSYGDPGISPAHLSCGRSTWFPVAIPLAGHLRPAIR